jgi:cyclophilin family peptidyl-prolyl cis-trans isomerase
LFGARLYAIVLPQTQHLLEPAKAGSFEGRVNRDVQMNNAFFRRVVAQLVVAATLLVFTSIGSAQYTNGIYAEFNTSLGSYTCALYYAQSPKAVANFIGLATGQRAWLDLPSGVVKTNPFYNGTIFHRVIAGFMIQGGSPNGVGTDGPAYSFVDEFTNTLRFDSFGVLAMANSGPDSNGSQYFVTVSPQPGLNDVHTIFGKLYGGSNVVYAINHATTDGNDKPLTNVVVQSVNIRRIGTAANAFDISTNGLPLVTNLNLKIARAGANVSLTFSNRLYADNRLYSSSNLSSWTANQLGIETVAPVSNTNLESAGAPAQFFRAAQIQYPSSTLAPKNMLNRTLTLSFNAGVGTIVIAFDSSGGGAYTYSGGSPGTVTSYTWLQQPYNGKLWPIYYSGLVPMTLALNYTNTTSGTFTGTAYSGTPFDVSGSFSHSP